MPVHHHDNVIDRNDPQVLLDLLESLPGPVVVGFQPTRRHVDLHIAPLPVDHRCGSAGLFGMRARHGWSAVGVSFTGRIRHLERDEVVAEGAGASVVVTRQGCHASRLRTEVPDEAGLDIGDLDGEGLLLDALHRVLGLPSPGEPPTPSMLALHTWAHEILRLLLVEGSVSWDLALRMHPGVPGPSASSISDEVIVEATLRAADGFRWESVHARAAGGAFAIDDLTAQEAAWMDTTLFARWVTATMPDPRVVADVLVDHDCAEVAERLLAVHDGVLHAPDPRRSR